ncbi:MAG: class I SAM-dependent methyltransferase [Candidatus Jordarchaeum sp.]|uniref:class I SAM-dependent methyltransferase n=1 Tax=Candidatus Jordarchaeum sp. TaxID=2823881 RepID=UPI00404B5FCF
MFPKKSNIIDVGTCHGNFAVRLASESYITLGLELQPHSLKLARWKMKNKKLGVMANINFVVGSASNLPAPPSSLDCVLFLETIEHLRESEKALHEIGHILRENGP